MGISRLGTFVLVVVGCGTETTPAPVVPPDPPPAPSPPTSLPGPLPQPAKQEIPKCSDAPANGGAAPIAAYPATPAGFTFGQTLDEATAVCKSHGFAWKAMPETGMNFYFCDGVPAMTSEVPFAFTNVTFCGGTVCHVDAVKRLSAEPALFERMRETLTRKFGRATCVDQMPDMVVYTWFWDGGSRREGSQIQLRLQRGTMVVDFFTPDGSAVYGKSRSSSGL